MTRNRWIIFAVICFVVLGGLVLVSRDKRADVSSVDINSIIKNDDYTDHVYGTDKPAVTIIEYGDFQCQSCQQAWPALKTIKEQYKAHVAFVFRHFPLTSIHPNALAASAAAEAASVQGKFWEMHDTLYQNHTAWSSVGAADRDGVFRSYAQQLGLKVDQFDRDIASSAILAKVNYARALGNKANVTGTPTIYVNGKQASNDEVTNLMQGDASKLRTTIDAQLKQKGITPPTSAASTTSQD